jgi:hypothetical protein
VQRSRGSYDPDVAALVERVAAVERELDRVRTRVHDLAGDHATVLVAIKTLERMKDELAEIAASAATSAVTAALDAAAAMRRQGLSLRAQYATVAIAAAGLVSTLVLALR